MGFSQNSTFGFGSTATDASGFVTAANEGLSVDGQTVQLGQALDEVGVPALLTEPRVLPCDLGVGGVVFTINDVAFPDVSLTLVPYSITLVGDVDQTPANIIMQERSNGDEYRITFSDSLNAFRISGSEQVVHLPSLAVGMNALPTARLHVGAGTATAGTAPIKIPPGTLMTTPETGAMENNGTHLYFTISSTRYQLDQQLAIGSTVVGATSGSVLFAGASSVLSQNNSNFYWDNSNNRLGVGINAPLSPLHINTDAGNSFFTITTVGSFGGDPVDVKYSIVPVDGNYGGAAYQRGGLQFQNESTYGGDPTTGIFSFDGDVGIAVVYPTAHLHVAAGTAAAGTAPIKIASGTNLTTPEDGALEYNGTHIYFTVGSTRFQLDQQLTTGSVSNGLSFLGGTFRLGQNFGAAGDPALCTSSREIPFNGASLGIIVSHATIPVNTRLSPNGLSITGNWAAAGPSSFQLDFDDVSCTYHIGYDVTFDGPAITGSLQGVYHQPFLGVHTQQQVLGVLHIGWDDDELAPLPQLLFDSGAVVASPVNGAMEYDGTNLFFTRAAVTRETVFTGNDGATAPGTTPAGAPANYYGVGGTDYLSAPNSWASVVVNGTTYKIPLYS